MFKQVIRIEIDLDFEYDHVPEIESWMREYFDDPSATIKVESIGEE